MKWPKWRIKMNLQIRTFFVVFISGLLTLLIAFTLFLYLLTNNTREQIAQQSLNIALLTSIREDVIWAYLSDDPVRNLGPIAAEILQISGANIVFMDTEGIRYTHMNSELIGSKFTGGDERPALREGKSYSSAAEGISGFSIRSFAPIYDFRDQQMGAVSAGFFTPDIKDIMSTLYSSFYLVMIVGTIVILFFSWLFTKNIKNIMFGMEPEEIAKYLKERESMLESVKEGIIAIDQNCIVTVVNHSAKDFFPPGIDIIGRNIKELVPDSKLPEILETKESLYDHRRIINHKPIITNMVPMILEDRVVGAIATFRPINEYNRLAEELTGVNRIVSSLKSRTHEFQNKLHVISGLIQLEKFNEAKDYIAHTSKYERDFVSLLIRNIDNAAILGFLVSKAFEAGERNIDFLLQEESLLYYLPDYFDENAMIVVLGNLIDNAIDAVKELDAKRRKIEIVIHQTQKEIQVSVQDSGKGIPDEIKNRVFEDFVSSKGNNRGMGLANLKRRITICGGKVRFRTSENGTTFYIRIPCETGQYINL